MVNGTENLDNLWAKQAVTFFCACIFHGCVNIVGKEFDVCDNCLDECGR